jgi:hypothetical protein
MGRGPDRHSRGYQSSRPRLTLPTPPKFSPGPASGLSFARCIPGLFQGLKTANYLKAKPLQVIIMEVMCIYAWIPKGWDKGRALCCFVLKNANVPRGEDRVTLGKLPGTGYRGT